MPVTELMRARIERLTRDPDAAYDKREWMEVDQVTADARHAPNVVLSTWLHEKDDDEFGLYRAVLPDGSRSDEVRFPVPNRRRSAA